MREKRDGEIQAEKYRDRESEKVRVEGGTREKRDGETQAEKYRDR